MSRQLRSISIASFTSIRNNSFLLFVGRLLALGSLATKQEEEKEGELVCVCVPPSFVACTRPLIAVARNRPSTDRRANGTEEEEEEEGGSKSERKRDDKVSAAFASSDAGPPPIEDAVR